MRISNDHNDQLSSTKIRHLLNILTKEASSHKFIVFSEFTSMLDLISPFLTTARLPFTRYDGSMRNDDREASLARLRNDPACRILLCSLKCGALGLNLTAASRVVILEPFWNPFVEEQAIDRVHRLNQTRDVVVYRLTIRDSVEERILELQEKKRELAKAAIEGGGMKGGKLDMKDIMSLFRREAEFDRKHEDGLALALASGTAGLLDAGRSTAPPPPPTSRAVGNGRVISGERPKWKSPGTASTSQFDASFGRRW
jgi:SNF2 family DNA or RNA helicase